MKTAICVWGHEKIGKTSVIRMAFDKLNAADIPPERTFGDDFCTTLDLCCHKVGFASMGDPNSEQENCLNHLLEKDCEVIVCASRTRGNTVAAVEKLVGNGYRLVWISPFSGLDINKSILNDLSANAIIKLINSVLMVK